MSARRGRGEGPTVEGLTPLREDALAYHDRGKPGKVALAVIKPCASQRDLSLAYTPGRR